MGKKDVKKEGRVKGNLQPAASSRAAELLGTGFGGFGISSGLAPTTFGASSDGDFAQVAPQLKVIFKKLSKRDSVTRVKALEELCVYLSTAEVDEIQQMLPAWPKLYNRLGIDADRRVRESTGAAHLSLVQKARKHLAPYLKELIGTWLCLQFDPAKDVGKAAADALQTAFPTKRTDVLVFCQVEILNFVSDNILRQTPETLSDPRFTSQEDMVSKYARVVSGSLYTLSYMLEQLSPPQSAKASSEYDGLLDDPKFWGMLHHDLAQIRRAAYAFLGNACVKWQDAIEPRLDKIAPTFLGKVFGDKDTSTHAELWDSVLLFTKTFPQSWMLASAKKPIVPKLCAFLKSGAYGGVSLSYPSLLALLANLPKEIVSTASFRPDFLGSIWKGLGSGAIDRTTSGILLNSYFECVLYLIVRAGADSAVNVQNQLVDVEMFKPLEALWFPAKFPEMGSRIKPEELETILSKYILKLGTSSQISSQLFLAFMSRLSNTIEATLESSVFPDGDALPAEDYVLFCRRAAILLVTIDKLTRQASGDTSIVQERTETLVRDVIAKAIAIIQPEPLLPGLAKFVRTLSESFRGPLFSHPASKIAITDFAVEKVPMLLRADSPALADLLDTVVVYIGALPPEDQEAFRQSWEKVVEAIFGLGEGKWLPVFGEVIKEVRKIDVNPAFHLQSERIDSYVRKLVFEQLEVAKEEEASLLEDVVSTCLSFPPDRAVLSLETSRNIAAYISEVLSTYTQRVLYLSGGDDGSVSASMQSNALAALNVVRTLLTVTKAAPFLDVFPQDMIGRVVADVFELSMLGDETNQDDDAELVKVGKVAQACWNGLLLLKDDEKFDLELIITVLTARWKEGLVNLHRRMSPSQLMAGVSELLSMVGEHYTLRDTVVKAVVETPDSWAEAGEVWKLHDPTLAVIDASAGLPMAEAKGTLSELEAAAKRDVHGFSVYARMVFCAMGLVKAIGLKALPAWISVELVRARIVSTDAAALGVAGPWAEDAVGVAQLGLDLDALVGDAADENNDEKWLVDLATNVGDIFLGKQSKAGEDFGAQVVFHATVAAVERSGEYARVLGQFLRNLLSGPDVSRDVVLAWLKIARDILPTECPEAVLAVVEALTVFGGQSELAEWISDQVAVVAAIDRNSALTTKAARLRISAITSFGQANGGFRTHMPQDKAFILLRRVRGWYETGSGIIVGEDVYLDVQVARLLGAIIADEVEIAVSLAGFTVELCRMWIQELQTTESVNRVVLHYALKLFMALLNAAERDPETWDAVGRAEKEIYRKLLDLFVAECVNSGAHMSKPQFELQALLSDLASRVPEEALLERAPFDELCNVTSTPNEEVQKAAFTMLRRLTAERVQATSLRVELGSRSGEERAEEQIPAALVVAIGKDDVPDVEEGVVDAGTHVALGYLLSWMIFFDHFEDATFQLKSDYISHIRSLELLPHFLEYIFGLLGVGWSRTPFDLSRWEFDSFEPEAFDIESSVGFPLLAAHLYWRSLRHAPSLVRMWWSECKNRQLTIAVESYTEKFFSPLLIRAELDSLSRADPAALQDLTVKTSRSEVTASYPIEDTTLDVVIRLPPTFPLRQVDMEGGGGGGGRNAGVQESRWRAWLLSVSAVMVAQNGSIVDALGVFKKNISLHFEGVEDCAICYSVIGVIDRTLPTKQCKTCKHLFHSSCLYKVRGSKRPSLFCSFFDVSIVSAS
ncbi:hypothetical protein HK104_008755 [Borealophlyctis nickersoniae]|nr:hypothetical protein HK104_008755 [Borealophlyctis nickersoniae]